MQESYSPIFMASGLFAYLDQGQNTWAPAFQSYGHDADEGTNKQSLGLGPEAAAWWNSYRSPASIQSSDSSGPNDEALSEQEDENVNREEGPRVIKPRASLLGKPSAGSTEEETWESGNNDPQGQMDSNSPANEKGGDLADNENIQQDPDGEGSQNVCLKCGKKYGRKSTLTRHLKIHSCKKPYRCATCGKGFAEKSQLAAHTKVHMKKLRLRKEPYECPECGEDFFMKASFNEHLATHNNEPTYPCPDCGKSYKEERYLDRHVTQAHSEAALFKCPDCGKGFAKEKDLTRHQGTTHADGSFYRRDDHRPKGGEESPLTKRGKRHTGKATHRGSECKKGFGDDTRLWRRHGKRKPRKDRKDFATKRESGAREYSHECSVCGRCFKDEKRFANHWRVHAREQRHEQAAAGGAFRGGNWHTRNQTTQVDFESDACFDCGKPLCADSRQPKIEMEGNLCKSPRFAKRQRRGHHEDLEADQQEPPQKKGSYRCSHCERVYSTLSNLRRHQRIRPGCRPPKGSSGGEGFAYAWSFPDNQKACAEGECSRPKRSCRAKRFGAKRVLQGCLPSGGKAKPYKCPICEKAFASKYTLSHHQETHEDEQPCLHLCSFCGKEFRTWSSLNRHQQLHLGEKRYQCTVCGKAFAYRDALARHREIHMERQFHECTFCLKTFPSSNSLSRHRSIHLKTRSYQCSICQKAFGTKYSLHRHQGMHDDGSPSKLTGGEESHGGAKAETNTAGGNFNAFPDSSVISGHENIYQEKESFESVVDPAWDSRLEENSARGLEEYKNTFGDGSGHPAYQARHANESVNPCCEDSINCKHKRVHIEGNLPELSGTMGSSDFTGQEEPLTGDRMVSRDCSKLAHNPTTNTEGHVSLSTDNLAYSGLIEGAPIGDNPSGSMRTFVDSSLVAEQQSTHIEACLVNGLEVGQDPVGVESAHTTHEGVVAGNESRTCLNGRKWYRDQYSLARHQVNHIMVTPYQCQTCKKSFQEPRKLARHQLTHTDFKPYQCHECGKCFKKRSSVDRHLKTHRERPYSCVYCGKRVTTGPNLQYHLRLHTGERPYKCAECDRGYPTLWSLKKHLKTHLTKSST